MTGILDPGSGPMNLEGSGLVCLHKHGPGSRTSRSCTSRLNTTASWPRATQPYLLSLVPWDRTVASIWMRKGNFDSLDTAVPGGGLNSAAKLTVDIWTEYQRDPERVLSEARRAYLNLV